MVKGTMRFKSNASYLRWLGAVQASGAAKAVAGHQRVYIAGREHRVEHGPELTGEELKEAKKQLERYKKGKLKVPKTAEQMKAVGPLVRYELFKEGKLPRKLATRDATRKLREGKRLTKRDITTLKTARTRGWLAKTNVERLERVLRKRKHRGG